MTTVSITHKLELLSPPAPEGAPDYLIVRCTECTHQLIAHTLNEAKDYVKAHETDTEQKYQV